MALNLKQDCQKILTPSRAQRQTPNFVSPVNYSFRPWVVVTFFVTAETLVVQGEGCVLVVF